MILRRSRWRSCLPSSGTNTIRLAVRVSNTSRHCGIAMKRRRRSCRSQWTPSRRSAAGRLPRRCCRSATSTARRSTTKTISESSAAHAASRASWRTLLPRGKRAPRTAHQVKHQVKRMSREDDLRCQVSLTPTTT